MKSNDTLSKAYLVKIIANTKFSELSLEKLTLIYNILIGE